MGNCIEKFAVEKEKEVSSLRTELRAIAEDFGFGLVKQTKIITACVELLRNALIFAGGGQIKIKEISARGEEKQGLQFVISDCGPGIDDPARAMKDGWSGPDSNGLGKGLPGSKNLSDEFTLETQQGEGTTVTIVFYR
ncbi:MAG: ATP-binding protein [bacterium]